VEKYGEESFVLYNLVLIVLVLINGVGIVLAGAISHKLDKKKLLLVSTIAFGILTLFVPFVDIWVFIALMAVNQISRDLF